MNITSRINSGQNLEQMFVRTLSRLIDLYSDRSHFIHELMQNAEDVCAHDMRFELYSDRLEVLHDGKPFTEDNLRGICDVGLSDKIGNVEQIGQFGIGFKAVFCICDVVRLYSCVENWDGPEFENLGSFSIEIQDFIHPVEIESIEVPWPYTTKFVFPFAVGKEYQSVGSCDDLASFLDDKLKAFDSCSLLFMKNLTSVTYVSHLGKKCTARAFSLKKKQISDDCVELIDDKNDKAPHYLRFSRAIEGDGRNVDIAYCVEPDKNGGIRFVKPPIPYLFIYFPSTTLSHLNFIVQGPYHTTPNRSTLPDNDEFNDMLVRETAELFRTSVLELKDMDVINFQFLSMLPLNPPASLYDSYTRTYRQKWLYDPVYRACIDIFENEAIIPTENEGFLSDLNHSVIIRIGKLLDIFDDYLISELIGQESTYITDRSVNLDENRELYDLLRSLKVRVIEVSSLPRLLMANKSFLPNRSKDWLCEFYSLLSDYPSLVKNDTAIGNFVDTPIILTQKGVFVCPRKNRVFEPSDIIDENYEYVDEYVFTNAHEFFNVLELGHPDILDSFIRKITKKYSGDIPIPFSENVQDWKYLIELLGNKQITVKQKKELSMIRMLAYHAPGDDKKLYMSGNFYADYTVVPGITNFTNYFLISSNNRDNIDVDILYEGVADTGIVDFDEYRENGVDIEAFNKIYDLYKIYSSVFKPMSKGWHRNPVYSNSAKVISLDPFNVDFDIWLSFDVFDSISRVSREKAMEKSRLIMNICRTHSEKMHGTLHERESNPIEREADCCLLAISKMFSWVYGTDETLHKISDLDRHDIDITLYQNMPLEADFYRNMGFKENPEDSVNMVIDDFYTDANEEKQSIFVDKIIQRHFGITADELKRKIEIADGMESAAEGIFNPDDAEFDEFPSRDVRNLERLKSRTRKYYEEAPSVQYEDRVVKHRVSGIPVENKEYVQSMYQYGSTGFYACQMCGKPTKYVTATQLDDNPGRELAPMHLCLCPSCYRQYIAYRKKAKGALINKFISSIEDADELAGNVRIPIGSKEVITFTATHLAEIKELLKCYATQKEDVVENTSLPKDEIKEISIEADDYMDDSSKDGSDAERIYVSPEQVKEVQVDISIVEPMSRDESFHKYLQDIKRRHEFNDFSCSSDNKVITENLEEANSESFDNVDASNSGEIIEDSLSLAKNESEEISAEEPLSREDSFLKYFMEINGKRNVKVPVYSKDNTISSQKKDEAVSKVSNDSSTPISHEGSESLNKYLETMRKLRARENASKAEASIVEMDTDQDYQQHELDDLENINNDNVKSNIVTSNAHSSTYSNDLKASDVDVAIKKPLSRIESFLNYFSHSKNRKKDMNIIEEPYEPCEDDFNIHYTSLNNENEVDEDTYDCSCKSSLTVRNSNSLKSSIWVNSGNREYVVFRMDGTRSHLLHIQSVFNRLMENKDRIPTRLELFEYGLSQHEYYHLSDYLSLVKNNWSLNYFVTTGIAHAFFRFIETLSMNKSYKIPVLLAFFKANRVGNGGTLLHSIHGEDLYKTCKEFYGDPSRRFDLVLPNNKSFDEADIDDFEVWAKQPIKYLTNKEDDWFTANDMDSLLSFSSKLESHINSSAFAAQFKDAVDYRYARYVFDRQRVIR